jgi:hypothetical protein
LFYNGIFEESTNLENWLQEIARSFLLRISDRGGKKAFRPRLPVNTDGTIFTNAVPWVFTFTEEHVLPDGFDIQYIPLTARKPICAQMLWRQQPDDDIGIIRSTEVRFAGEAISGPFEQYDLSNFCTSEDHAVKIGAYEVARRKFIEHTLRLQVRPASFNATISLGDIVRVELRRESTAGDVTLHNYLYEVERINRNISGSVELDLTHFPVNKDGQSLLAMYVLDAEGAGFELPTGRDNFQCDIPGRDEDETPLTLDPYTDPNLPPSSDFDYDLPDSPDFDPLPAPPGGGFGGTGGPGNPEDPLEEDIPLPIQGASGPNGTPVVGDSLTLPEICPGMLTKWYLIPEDGGPSVQVSAGEAVPFLIGPELTGFSVYGEGCCPDPGAPGGFAQCVETAVTPAVEPDVTQYQFARWTGTRTTPSGSTTETTGWLSYNPAVGLTLSGAWGCFLFPVPLSGKSEAFSYPAAETTWRASVSVKQHTPCGGGNIQAGLFGNAPNPVACVGGLPTLSISCTAAGSVWSLSGAFEFSNDESTIEATWKGRKYLDPSDPDYEENI